MLKIFMDSPKLVIPWLGYDQRIEESISEVQMSLYGFFGHCNACVSFFTALLDQKSGFK